MIRVTGHVIPSHKPEFAKVRAARIPYLNRLAISGFFRQCYNLSLMPLNLDAERISSILPDILTNGLGSLPCRPSAVCFYI